MARLPDYLHPDGHVTRGCDRVVVHLRADVSGFLAVARNLGPAWDALEQLYRELALAHRHHRREHPDRAAMHSAYDRRRRARRRR